MNSGHVWKFFRAGGFDQVRLDTGADLEAPGELDQKFWVALSCPTRGVELDTDKDGRIRAPEIIAATKWACSCLRNPDDLATSAPSLPLSAINGNRGRILTLDSAEKPPFQSAVYGNGAALFFAVGAGLG